MTPLDPPPGDPAGCCDLVSVLLAKRALPRSLGDAPPPEVAAALAQLPGAFGQLGLAAGDASLNIKALKGQPGLYRLRVGDWRAIFFPLLGR